MGGGEIGNDGRVPLIPREGFQKSPAEIAAGGPRSHPWTVPAKRVRSPAAEGAGSCPLPDRLAAR